MLLPGHNLTARQSRAVPGPVSRYAANASAASLRAPAPAKPSPRATPTPNASPPTPQCLPAFTLLEVTISVAIAVVLMLGISQVFKVVGDTVGTGQALATAQRDARASQAVMASDFNSAVTDTAPFMMLYSRQIFAFRNLADLQGDKDGLANTFDPYGTGTESAQPAAIYNYRSHRIDALTFFGRGSFSRQTGADVPSAGASPFISNMGGLEAMLWYGHLNLANNSGAFTNFGADNTPGNGTSTPGTPTYYNTINPNNYFATSWILGRQQILLQPTTSLYNNNTALTPPAIIDLTNPGTVQYAYMPKGPPLAPLAAQSEAYASSGTTSPLKGVGGGTFTLLSSRIDLAATSILGFRNVLSSYIPTNTYPPASPSWWQALPAGQNSLRFQAQPFFLTKPPTPESMAYQAPIFIRGCTQFTVEYAGDYLNQDPKDGHVINAYATVTGTPPNETAVTIQPTDGQIDYIPEYVAGTASGQNLVRKIRWYGLPRSTTNNTTINSTNGDVTPLRDLWPLANGSQAPFEVVVPTLPTSTPVDYAPQSTGMHAAAQYICAWGPNDPKPKMIRITMTIDDPGGRLGDGQTYEYIYTLP